MKKLIIIISITLGAGLISSFNNLGNENAQYTYSEFCQGWDDGYCQGWKDVKGRMIVCPVTPVCPIPSVGENNYRGGYNRGFKAGMRAAYR